jgi:DNA-binding GntR family transcriptional regulator
MNQPIQMTTSVASACQVIRRCIQAGTYPGGSWIREMTIAQIAKVSRTSVRQALNVLALEGFVELHPNRGAMVVDWNDDNLLEVFDVRVMLESYACELTAERATAQDVETLKKHADSFSELVEKDHKRLRQKITQVNNDLHQQILHSCGNQRLATLLVAVVQVPLVHQTFARYEIEDLRRSASQHHDLVQAIARKDREWARATMMAHLLSGKQVIFANKNQAVASIGEAKTPVTQPKKSKS